MTRTLAGVGIALTVAIVAVWATRTYVAEKQAGRGRGQRVTRGRVVRLTDLVLWLLGVGWAAVLTTFFVLTLTGA